MSKRLFSAVLLLTILTSTFGLPAAAKTTKTTKAKKTTATTGQYFHKIRKVHKKVAIPKDPKPSKIEVKKAKQQAIAGRGYVKKLKGWLSKKSKTRVIAKKKK